MPYVRLSNRAILRAEPTYGDSWIVFNHYTYSARFLARPVFSLLHAIGRQPMFLPDFEKALGILLEEQLSAAEFLRLLIQDDFVSVAEDHLSTYIHPLPTAADSISDNYIYASAPTSVELCITRRCNLSCVHCNVSAKPLSAQEKLDIEFWIDLVDQCVESNVLRLTITGGEPFKREGFQTLLEKLASSRIGSVILTNGTDITDQQMDILAGAHISLSVSLDGATASSHDSFRGKLGAFEETIGTLERLSRRNVLCVLNMTLTDRNLQDAKRVLDIGTALGVSRVVFVPIYSVGRASSNVASDYFPDRVSLQRTIAELLDISRSGPGPEVVLGDPSEKELFGVTNRSTGPTPMSKRHSGFCKAGMYGLAIDEDGLAYSCLRGLQTKVYAVGDLRTSRLTEVWRSALWKPWRDPSIAPVPCRVEQIERDVPASDRRRQIPIRSI